LLLIFLGVAKAVLSHGHRKRCHRLERGFLYSKKVKKGNQRIVDTGSIAVSSWDCGWLRQRKGAAALPRFGWLSQPCGADWGLSQATICGMPLSSSGANGRQEGDRIIVSMVETATALAYPYAKDCT